MIYFQNLGNGQVVMHETLNLLPTTARPPLPDEDELEFEDYEDYEYGDECYCDECSPTPEDYIKPENQ